MNAASRCGSTRTAWAAAVLILLASHLFLAGWSDIRSATPPPHASTASDEDRDFEQLTDWSTYYHGEAANSLDLFEALIDNLDEGGTT